MGFSVVIAKLRFFYKISNSACFFVAIYDSSLLKIAYEGQGEEVYSILSGLILGEMWRNML